jgi:hypothetical protein
VRGLNTDSLVATFTGSWWWMACVFTTGPVKDARRAAEAVQVDRLEVDLHGLVRATLSARTPGRFISSTRLVLVRTV